MERTCSNISLSRKTLLASTLTIVTRPLRQRSEHLWLACPFHGLCGFTEVSNSKVHVTKSVPTPNTNATPSFATVVEIGTEDWTAMLDNDALRLLWGPRSRLLDVGFLVVGRIRKVSASLIIMACTPHRPWTIAAQG